MERVYIYSSKLFRHGLAMCIGLLLEPADVLAKEMEPI
jgi:hypothetical protein